MSTGEYVPIKPSPCTTRDVSSDALSRSDEDSAWPSKKYDEAARNKLKEIMENALDHKDASHDVWGAIMYVIINDLPDIKLGTQSKEQIIRVSFVLVCYFMNLFLQVMLIFWIGQKVMLPSMLEAQDSYSNFHRNAFTSGDLDKEKFHNMGDERAVLCQVALSSELFLGTILFLWVSACMVEIRGILSRVRYVNQLPQLPAGTDATQMIVPMTEGEGHFVKRKQLFICIDTSTKFMLWMAIFLPKLILGLCLLLEGCVWLAAAESTVDLILNSLALAFVTQIDELIYSVYLPPRLGKNLEETTLACPMSSLTPEVKEAADIVEQYGRSLMFLVMVLVIVVAVMQFQPVLPHYAWDVSAACQDYVQDHSLPWCAPWDRNCFPHGV